MPWLDARALVRRAIVRYSVANRCRKAILISNWMNDHSCQTVLLVGSLGEEDDAENAGIVERAVAKNRAVVAAINLYHRTTPYRFVLADARYLPFAPRSIDFALSNAIIEHVGEEKDQRRMVSEHERVTRCWAITTPNRWFPIESHTGAVVLHWFPRWRARREEFSRLLSPPEFKRLLPRGTTVVGRWWSPTMTALYDSDVR